MCGYSLVGLPDGRCPECGWHFTHGYLAEFDRERLARKAQKRDAAFASRLAVMVITTIALMYIAPAFDSVPKSLGGAWVVMFTLILPLRGHDRAVVLAASACLMAGTLLLDIYPSYAEATFVGVPVVIVAACVTLVHLLRRWPVLVSILLMVGAALPLFLLGSGITMQGIERVSGGYMWMDYDVPTLRGWRWMQPTTACVLGPSLVAIALAIPAGLWLLKQRLVGSNHIEVTDPTDRQ